MFSSCRVSSALSLGSSPCMGRKRIHIAKISSDKRRRATFTKRRKGLLKKAMELSILCDCEVSVFIMAKDETSVYTTNGDPAETVQRALSKGPMVTHNGMYESLYFGNDDDDSLDDFEGEDDVDEPIGGSLTSRPKPTRAKRKRDQVQGSAPPEPTSPVKRRAAPLHEPSKSLSSGPTLNQAPSSLADANTHSDTHHAPVPPGNDQTSVLIQQMAILSQLLAQQSRTPGETTSPGTFDHNSVSQISANLLGALKSSVDQFASPSSAQNAISLTEQDQQAINNGSGSGNSPLIPVGELSPGMTGLSPHFPFAGLTPPVIPSTLTPPALDGHILDVNFSGSPAREVPTFHDLNGRLGKLDPDSPPGLRTSTASSAPQNASSSSYVASKHRPSHALSVTGAGSNGPGLGLRVAVPAAPRVFNIPPHLMSSTAPPTGGVISGNANHNNANASETLSSTSASNSSGPTQTSGTKDKYNPPPLSSMQPPAFPWTTPSSSSSSLGGAPTNASVQEWAPLQSPLVNPSSFGLYSPFLYSPRI